MNLRTKIGQMLCIGFDGPYPSDEFFSIAETYKIGNITLFANNFISAAQASDVMTELRMRIKNETGFYPFLSVDQEGGMVTRFPEDFTHFPGAMAVAATGTPDYAFQAGYLMGLEMKQVGIDFDLAPVVDINTNPANPVIGVRSYGDTAEQVEHFAFEMMEGLEQAGIMSILKHFPGHGDTSQDSHFSLPQIDKSLDELMELELKPYIEGIRRGVPSIMTSHIVLPNIDPSGLPATMSKILITDILRNLLGFQGMVRTDDLEMDAIMKHFGIIEGAIQAIKAGVDIIAISHSPHLVHELVMRIEQEVAEGTISIQLIDDAVSRIVACKKKYCHPIPPNLSLIGCSLHRGIANKISRESITLIQDPRHQLPVKTGNTLVVGTYAFNQTNVRNPLLLELNFASLVSEALHAEGITIHNRPDAQEIETVLKMAGAADTVIFGTYNAHLYQEQAELAGQLAASHNNVIFTPMRNPYDVNILPNDCAIIAAYEYTKMSISSLTDVLLGSRIPTGHLCVTL